VGILWQDMRYGVRMLGRNPGFTAVVVVILALGIGATTTMLSVIDAVLLRPPPYEDPERLVYLYSGETNSKPRGGGETSFPNFADWKRQSTVFEQVAGFVHAGFLFTTDTGRERVVGEAVSAEYFSALRVKPAFGRVFGPEEEQREAAPVVVVSHRFWQDRLGGDPNVLNRTVVLDQKAYTVIGVLSADFRDIDGRALCVYVPLPVLLSVEDMSETARGGWRMLALARLKPGVTLAQARSEMDLIGRRLAQAYPDTNGGTTVSVVPLTEKYAQKVGRSRPVLLAAQSIVAFILLLACLHVASLLLVRSAARETEMAVRAALGAWRLRLTRQLLTESLLLALLGGTLGLLVAHWSLGLISILRSWPESRHVAAQIQRLIPWFVEVRLDLRTLAYVTAVSLLTCAGFGILPALQASKTSLNRSLAAGRTLGQDLSRHAMRSALVVTDVALAFVLLSGAGLLVNSYARLNSALGYNPEKVLVAEVCLGEDQADELPPNQCLAFFEQLLRRLRSLPGVHSATAVDWTPAWGGGNFPRFRIEGYSPAVYRTQDNEGFPSLLRRVICPDYFRVLQTPLLKGRLFTDADRAGAPAVILINEAMARRFWPQANPIGRHLWDVREHKTEKSGTELTEKEYEIVGVVGNVKHLGASDRRLDHPEVYIPYGQTECYGAQNVLIRTSSNPRDMIKTVRSAVLTSGPNVTIDGLTLLEDDIAGYVSPERFRMFSLGAFAVVALVLACTGVYGITAYAVSRRTHEIGIRMALGARRGDVLKTVLRQGLTLTIMGLTLGLAGALAATRVLCSLLYEVSPTDPLTFVCVAVLLAGVALLASYLPARRAAQTDPMVALRYE
jgi:putative ABC transport system permease protein